jgi:DNA polymerase-3 subunit gamma/tau
MLSNSAFNALLKTLEEPPEHVKFILATTEIKKIPLTVASRCQRFDLHRLTIEELANYLQSIAKKEGFEIKERASMLISKAAGGSARDGLSLLDQAILTCKDGIIDLESITQMLGIVSLEYIYNLFDLVLTGKLNDALDIIRDLYTKGAEPFMILQELIEISYKITLCKIGDAKNLILSDFELKKCNLIADKTSIIILTRFWQMFNKALVDMKTSHNEMLSLEMTIIKISHVNLTITPEEILKSLDDDGMSSKITQPSISQDVKKNSLI